MLTLHYPEYGRLCLQEAPPPVPAADSLVIKVAACGVCGSEIETFKARSPRRKPPLVMGHEFCGTVAQAGGRAGKYREGDRVIANALVPCDRCPVCLSGRTHLCPERQIFGMDRPGAFAEYVEVPARSLIAWPAGVSATEAVFSEPLANGVHIVNLTRHLAAETVLVIGAGPIGLMCQLAFLALRSSRVFVTDLNPDRLKRAAALGAIVPANPSPDGVVPWIKTLTAQLGVDLVIDAVGSAGTKLQSLEGACLGGAVVWIGLHQNEISLPSYEVTLRERQILGTYAARMDELETAAELIASGRAPVAALADPYPLADGVRAFETACRGQNVKSVLIPS